MPELFLEFVGQVIHEALIKVFTAQERVAIGRFDFENTITDLQDRDVKRAAAEVVNGNRAGMFLVHAVRQCRRRGFIDDAQNLKPRDLSGILCCLPLRVVEIGRYGDYRLRNLLAQIGFRGFLHFLQNKRGNFRRGEPLPLAALNPGVAVIRLNNLIGDHTDVFLGHRIVEPAPNQALDGEKCVFGIRYRLPFGGLTDQSFAVPGKSDDGGGCPGPFGILDDFGRRSFHHRNTGIGGSKIDADNFCHITPPWRTD